MTIPNAAIATAHEVIVSGGYWGIPAVWAPCTIRGRYRIPGAPADEADYCITLANGRKCRVSFNQIRPS